MPVLEVCCCGATLLVKREERLDVGVLDRAPKRAARQRVRIVLAQAGSSFSVFGLQVKIFERLAVMPRPDVVGSADDELPDFGRAARHVESLHARAVQPEIDGIGHLGNTAASAARTAAASSRAFALDLEVLARRVTPTQCSPAFTGTRTW